MSRITGGEEAGGMVAGLLTRSSDFLGGYPGGVQIEVFQRCVHLNV